MNVSARLVIAGNKHATSEKVTIKQLQYLMCCFYRAGVAFFEAAIQAGTDDLRTLSAIYSQLGNAYFYLGEYTKAMQYHKHDLTLARLTALKY